MLDAVVWFVTSVVQSVWHLVVALARPDLWLDWSNGESLGRFMYYGASQELFFVVFTVFTAFTLVGMARPGLLWGATRGLEGFANAVGRIAAWAGLLMVLQQIVVIFVQRIFAASDIGFGLGTTLSLQVSWWSDELKLYNAIVVALCCAWTFVQKGHVRVDLLYSPASFRTKKIIDMVGAVLFMMPFAVITWLYCWFFLWRHLVTPKVSASDTLDMMLRKGSILRWNVETIGFSPNGFNGYFLFKILLVAFAGMIFLHAWAVLWRSYLEFREGPESENRWLDLDVSGGDDAVTGTH